VITAGSLVAKGSHNLYIPIPFEKSIRVDVVTDCPILSFMHLDYRLNDESLNGIKLIQKGEGEKMELLYKGLPKIANNVDEVQTKLPRKTFSFTGDRVLTLDGPGIIRRLSFNSTRRGVRLRIRFDGEKSNAVDVDLADFFGPFRGVPFNNNSCYLPMPFAKSAEIEIVGSGKHEEWRVDVDVEPVKNFKENWGYFHAQSSTPAEPTGGFLPFQTLYTRGRGQWVGMSLYETGHDHGGGDFAVIDGESSSPDFLHGDFGEDYFSFAFFGRGENFPYSEAFSNEEGRMRLHTENPYTFRESIEISWGVLPDHHPRAVSFWYQDSPQNLTLDEKQSQNLGLKWKVFGPVEATCLEDGNTPDTSDPAKLFAGIPSEESLDAGNEHEVTHIAMGKRFTRKQKGWAEQTAVGPHLNLMYAYGHVMKDLGGHHHIGYYPRAMLARTTLNSPKDQRVTLQLSYDDPLTIELNGKEVYSDMKLREGFVTRRFEVQLQKGKNPLLIRMLDTPNNNTCWAAISLRMLESDGNEIRL